MKCGLTKRERHLLAMELRFLRMEKSRREGRWAKNKPASRYCVYETARVTFCWWGWEAKAAGLLEDRKEMLAIADYCHSRAVPGMWCGGFIFPESTKG